MKLVLNTEQIKGLSNFLFDIAKGLVLGGIGLSLTIPFEMKIVLLTIVSMFTVACLSMALNLLKEI